MAQIVPAGGPSSPGPSARLKVPDWWSLVEDETTAFPGLSGVQLLAKMDEQFLLDGDVHLMFVDDAGEFLIGRDPWNDGLNRDTVVTKQQSIFTDGWIPGIRGGPWVRGIEPTLVCSPRMKCLAFHADSLIRGLEAAKAEAPDHPHVLKALEEGLDHCKVYHPLIPKWAVRFYKKMGNLTNDGHRVTTLVEIYELSIEGQNVWKRLKNENGCRRPPFLPVFVYESVKCCPPSNPNVLMPIARCLCLCLLPTLRPASGLCLCLCLLIASFPKVLPAYAYASCPPSDPPLAYAYASAYCPPSDPPLAYASAYASAYAY